LDFYRNKKNENQKNTKVKKNPLTQPLTYFEPILKITIFFFYPKIISGTIDRIR